MRVLAIGATGFIGGHVVRLLVERGHDVAVLHRGETRTRLAEGARHLRGDRDRLGESRVAIERFAPEAVLDAILYTEQQARELVATLRGRVGRVVALSSADVYRNYDGLRGKAAAPPDPGPLAEDAPLRESRYPYRGAALPFAHAHDYEKILVERVLQGESALPTTVLRLPAVYGPGDRQHRLRPTLACMTPDRSPLRLDPAQAGWRWTRGFVENVALAAALAVADSPDGSHVYNVGDEPTLSEREWTQRVAAAAGWRGDVVVAGAPEPGAPPLDWRYALWTDTRRIRRELGYAEAVSLDDALRRTVAWERAQRDEASP